MAQIKIYGLKSHLAKNRTALSSAIHAAIVDVLAFPPEKRFHRFIGLDKEDFIFPPDRSENYTIIEISMFKGRSSESKKLLISQIFANIEHHVGILPHDIEINLTETPMENWGIRGLSGHELVLGYKVEV